MKLLRKMDWSSWVVLVLGVAGLLYHGLTGSSIPRDGSVWLLAARFLLALGYMIPCVLVPATLQQLVVIKGLARIRQKPLQIALKLVFIVAISFLGVPYIFLGIGSVYRALFNGLRVLEAPRLLVFIFPNVILFLGSLAFFYGVLRGAKSKVKKKSG